jgi:hypothetical protein
MRRERRLDAGTHWVYATGSIGGPVVYNIPEIRKMQRQRTIEAVQKEDADPKETPIGKILPLIGVISGFGSYDAGGGFRLSFGGFGDRYGGITRHTRDKDFKSLKDKLTALIEVLDKSDDSQWLATYMIEEGASRCDLALEMFKDYLKWCKT